MMTIFSWAMPVVGFFGILFAYKTYNDINIQPDGNARMREIALAIRQ